MDDDTNLTKLREIRDRYGPVILERLRVMILERAETFPDRTRAVVWLISVSPDGDTIELDVRP